MIISTIRMPIPIEKHNDVLRVFRSIAQRSRNDPGCLSYSGYRDLEESEVLMIQGVWKSEENLKCHIRSNEYLNLLMVLEMSLEQPEVRFDTISSSTGIETVERIRSAIGRG